MADKHRNRKAGKAFEKYVITKIKQLSIFPDLARSAEIAQDLDAKGIDIVTIDLGYRADFSYNIQCKTSTKAIDFRGLLNRLSDIDDKVPVVFNRRTHGESQGRFVTEGEYAILYMSDFINIIGELEQYKAGFKIYNDHWDEVDPSDQSSLNKELEKINL